MSVSGVDVGMMPRMIARLLARVGLVTPEQRAWAWYDWANSVYFTTVITAVFPSFYATYAAKGLEPAQATARFGADHDRLGADRRGDRADPRGARRLQRHQEAAARDLHDASASPRAR